MRAPASPHSWSPTCLAQGYTVTPPRSCWAFCEPGGLAFLSPPAEGSKLITPSVGVAGLTCFRVSVAPRVLPVHMGPLHPTLPAQGS